MRKLLLGIGLLPALILQAQNQEKKPITLSGYIDTYYQYDFGEPRQDTRPDFLYSYNRHNQYTVNVGLIKASYQQVKFRANLALAAGTYIDANYSSESKWAKHIFEANVGVKLSAKKNVWLDAGIFPSHIGFESAIGKDNWTLTRSIQAENSPYYETGVKLSYTSANGTWFLSALVLNGWQRIQLKPFPRLPSFGHQLTYKPSANFTLNSSSFIGAGFSDTTWRWRYFHNLYAQFQFNEKWGLISGFDMGAQKNTKNSHSLTYWLSPVVIAQYKPTPKLAFAGRVEYYHDPEETMISVQPFYEFFTWGYSLNVDYRILENVLWRTELRSLNSDNAVYVNKGMPSKSNLMAITSIAVSL